MTDHLQTILNFIAEPITLPQDVSAVSVVFYQRSLRHDDANIENVCH